MRGIFNVLHPLMIWIAKKQELPDIVMVNKPPIINGNAIYVTNHQCVYDIPVAALSIPRHVYLLMGKQRLEIKDRLFFCLNGALWVDRKSKESKHKTKERIKKLISQGENVFLFPEGTWNYTPNELLLPLNWGCIEIAQFCNVPIVPFAMDYLDNRCKIKWGEKLSIPKTMDKKTGIELLEERMATLLWELCEDEKICHREDISSDWWNQEWERRVLAYPKLDAEYERSVARQVRY